MVTSKEYKENLKKGIVTEQMVSDALYSVNKRAKNARDKEREFRPFSLDLRSAYLNEVRYKETKERYYAIKDEMLRLYSAVHQAECVHRLAHLKKERKKVYDYQEEFEEALKGKVVRRKCYYDYLEDREVWFVVIITKEWVEYEYFFFYNYGERSFHQPTDETSAINSHLQIIDIEKLETKGRNVNDLMSMDFVNKVLDVLRRQYGMVGNVQEAA